MPHKRELDAGAYALADKQLTDLINQGRIAGEICGAMTDGAISRDTLCATLGEIIAGQKKGRKDDEEITVFESTEMAIEDAAAGKKAYELALEKGLGVEVSITP
jgi:alanine dehydrogenase